MAISPEGSGCYVRDKVLLSIALLTAASRSGIELWGTEMSAAPVRCVGISARCIFFVSHCSVRIELPILQNGIVTSCKF